jgi:hypothetical protein
MALSLLTVEGHGSGVALMQGWGWARQRLWCGSNAGQGRVAGEAPIVAQDSGGRGTTPVRRGAAAVVRLRHGTAATTVGELSSSACEGNGGKSGSPR